MFNNRGITFKAVFLFVLISTVILATVRWYNYSVSSRIAIEMAEENCKLIASDAGRHLVARIKPLEKVVQNLAIALENPELTSENLVNFSQEIILKNDNIYGTSIAFEPYTQLPDQLFYAPYSYRGEKEVETKMLGSNDYRYFHLDWYQLPKELGTAVWTEPYYDTGGGNILMTTYSVPFYRVTDGVKQFAGVVTADVSLKWIQERFSQIKLYESGYAVLLSENGSFVFHPSKDLVLNETIFSLAESLGDKELWDIGKALKNRESGFITRTSYTGEKQSFVYYMPVSVSGWSLILLFPKNEVLKKITDLSYKTLFIDLTGWLLLIIAITLLTRRFTKPLISLSQSAGEIAKGNLDTLIPATTSKDELGKLTSSFINMQSSLKDHIVQLTDTTTQKERIESELRIARDIQMSILPKIFPAFPEQEEFSVFASIEPAREIGGDLYDFFFIDENRFCFLIGDVSGKGVPAAFFMAVTKTLLKVIAEQTADPAQILEKVNNDLAVDNDNCMFVTLFIGILDIQSGMVFTGNAGHNAPVLLSEGNVEYLPSLNEPLAGAMEGMEYTTRELPLKKDDVLFLYTDGVTEAMNIDNELYSDDRLIVELKKGQSDNPENAPEKCVKHIESSIVDFTKGAEQSDDITMLCLRYHGPTATKKDA